MYMWRRCVYKRGGNTISMLSLYIYSNHNAVIRNIDMQGWQEKTLILIRIITTNLENKCTFKQVVWPFTLVARTKAIHYWLESLEEANCKRRPYNFTHCLSCMCAFNNTLGTWNQIQHKSTRNHHYTYFEYRSVVVLRCACESVTVSL